MKGLPLCIGKYHAVSERDIFNYTKSSSSIFEHYARVLDFVIYSFSTHFKLIVKSFRPEIHSSIYE
jgi:hypothetical protein